MTIKATKAPEYTAFKTEIETLIKEQDDFLSELYVWMQECEVLDKAEVTIFSLKVDRYRQPTTPQKKSPGQ